MKHASLLSIATLSYCLAAGSASAALLAHYAFDGSANDFSDSSGNGYDLSSANGTPVTTTTGGVFGGMLDLVNADGEYLTIGGSADFTFESNEAWSVSFWAKRRSGAGSATGMVMGDLTQGGFIWNTANSGQVSGGDGTGGLRFRPSSTSAGSGNNDYAVGTNTAFNHHAVVADGAGNITYYYNNVSQGTSTASPDTDFNILAIGNAYTGTSLSFDGQLDEIYIFDETIDSTTVGSLFTSNTIPEPSTFALFGLGALALLGRRR